ncbi:MAG: SUMF1/EgtB/PvdO family nonheme iron enzyme [Candidatus Aegiribacteria sp.]|nr:SUMF1/EgtB/PvdO family nonheme iron enzyme [Candidatus Aegiribacteria sp.]
MRHDQLTIWEKSHDYRLPTETEWECACLTGSQPFSSSADSFFIRTNMYSWCEMYSENSSHPVGKKEVNGFGLFDMIGKVSELCVAYCGDYILASDGPRVIE